MSASTPTSIFASRVLALASVARSRKFCAVLSLLLTAFFALLALSAAQAHAQAVSGSVAAVPVINTLAGDDCSGYSGDGGAATSAELANPVGVAVDNAGNTYIADEYNQRIRMVAATTGTVFGQSVTAGDIYTVAGDGTKGFSGDGGLATLAGLYDPAGVAVDSAGNIYIADKANQRIRVVAAETGTVLGISMTAGDIYTVAGSSSTGGYYGNGVLATSAKLNNPEGVALDGAGNIYIADRGNNLVRVVAATTGTVFGQSVTAGYIYTVAGNGTAGYLGDCNPATSAELNSPAGVTVDSAGDLYIADLCNDVIRMVAANNGTVLGQSVAKGDIYTVAGDGCGGYSGDGFPATGAELSSPTGVALDSAGDLYIADECNYVIRMVAANTGTVLGQSVKTGDIYTVAGDNLCGYSGDGGAATSARLDEPTGVAVDRAGDLYIADSCNDAIREVSASTNFPPTAVGASAAPQNVLVELTANSAISSISVPKAQNGAQEFTVNTSGITGCIVGGASNPSGTICTVSVTFNPQYPGVRMGTLTLNNGSSAIVGTAGLYGVGQSALGVFTPGTASVLSVGSLVLNGPEGVAVDGAGNRYIADRYNNRVVEVTAAGTVSVVNTGSVALSQDGGVAVDGAGNLYIANMNSNQVVKVTAEGAASVLSTGSLTLSIPTGVAVDTAGDVYIADALHNRIVEVAVGGAVSVLSTGSLTLNQPTTVVVDNAGNIYITDANNNRVVKVTPAGVASVLAVGTPNGTGLNYPFGLGVDAAGDVYIADGANNRVVEVAAGGAVSVLNTGSLTLNNPTSATVDGAGNIYIADFKNNRVVALNQSQQALTFPSTAVGTTSAQQVVTVSNIGNQALDFTALGVTTNFSLGGAGTTCTGSISLSAGGAGCDLGVEFEPTTSGSPLTGTVNITDNSLNAVAPNNVQVVNLSGTAPPTPAATPTFSPAGGTYTSAQSVTISSTSGATIYYTTNGTTPTTSSTPYTGPITVSSSETIEAIATASGYTTSAVGSAAYTITPPAATPTFSPAGGTYTSAQSVTISDATSGATIYYTTNGTTPTTSSTPYTGAITVSSSETIEAIATASGYTTSAAGSAAYTINIPAAATPTFSPAGGTYTSAQSVTISSTTSGAVIHCAINATATASSPVCSSPISVTSSETISAVATATGYTTSAVGSATYTINIPIPQAATPTFSPAGGTYTSAQTVTISDATSGAKIYYTTNGTMPTTSSTVYSGPITVSATETIEAIATASGYTTSAAGSAAYTIPPSFTMAATPNTLTIPTGGIDASTLTITPSGGYTGTLTLSCSGLPANAYCYFPGNAGAQTTTVTLNGSNTAQSIALNIETGAMTAPPMARMQAMPSPFGQQSPSSPLSPILPALAFWWPGSMAGLAAFGRKRGLSKTRQRMLQLCLLVLMTGALAAGISGCAGLTSSAAAVRVTPAGTSTVTVTATPASGKPQTTTITVTIT